MGSKEAATPEVHAAGQNLKTCGISGLWLDDRQDLNFSEWKCANSVK
jgi:hypothetical protein